MRPESSSAASSRVGADPIGAEAVASLLLALVEPGSPWVAGVPLDYRVSCASTNAALKEMADSAPAGTAIVTDQQTTGRGRLGRTWISAPGLDLTFSVLLRPSLPPERGHLLSLAAGVAVAEVLEETFDLRRHVALKWPNDVLLKGKKVCGILLEASADVEHIHWAVAGVGLNVNSEPEHFADGLGPELLAEWQGRPTPVSLKEHLGRSVPRAPLLAALLVRLTLWWGRLDEDGAPALLEEWRRRDAFAGRRVAVHAGTGRAAPAVSGIAAGIGEQGQLLVRTGDGRVVEVFAGDVSVTSAGDPD